MDTHQALISQIDALFHPRSIAIVGAPREVKTGSVFLLGLLEQGFPGPINPVNPQAGEINGLKAYPRINDIPGPVDLAIILVPVAHSLSVVKESRKPLMMVKIPSRDLKLDRQFCEAGIPFFDSAERAVRTYALVYRYQRWRQNHPEPTSNNF